MMARHGMDRVHKSALSFFLRILTRKAELGKTISSVDFLGLLVTIEKQKAKELIKQLRILLGLEFSKNRFFFS